MDSRSPEATSFDLLETMKWTREDGFFLLGRHLLRMHRSARYFGFPWREQDIIGELDRCVSGAHEPQRVRLLVARDGAVRVECTPLSAATPRARLAIADRPIDPSNVFLFHKTTYRTMYTDAARPGFDDTILWNPSGEATETTLGNLVVEVHGRKATPLVDCGLLPGTFRAEMLERGDIVEQRVTLDELKAAASVWVINSVREWWPAEVVCSVQL